MQKKKLTALVTNNEMHNNWKKLLQILGVPGIQTEEGYLDTAATSHFITTTCPGKPVAHKPMQVCCTNTTTMDSTATKEININLPLSKKRQDSICHT